MISKNKRLLIMVICMLGFSVLIMSLPSFMDHKHQETIDYTQVKKNNTNSFVDNFYYAKDKKTGLCFATCGLEYYRCDFFATVPCTPEVERQIQNSK